MPTAFSAMLRAVNRVPGSPLRILCADTHEAYQTVLARTGHQFYSLPHQAFKQWDRRFRPMPVNYQPLNPQRPFAVDMAFDLILSQNKFGQFQVLSQLARQMNFPLVSLEHTLPVPQWPQSTRDECRQQRGVLDVFISEYSAVQWGFNLNDPNVRVVHHGIETNFWKGWTGGDGKVLTVVNDYVNRDWCCGYSLYRQVTEGLPTNPWGATQGLSQPAKSPNHLRDVYATASVFLNTSTVSPVPTAMLEAMSVGCPVVTTSNCMLPEIITDGVNGFITNDPAVMRQHLLDLIRDRELAAKIGRAGRETVLTKFSDTEFIRRWNFVFEEAVGRPVV